MMRNPGIGDNHNAGVFADCYGRMGSIIPELVHQGRNPRVMLDFSGELLFGLRKMGRGDVLDRLRGITCDHHLRKYVEWLGTMWGHAVASSTPLPDLKLHMRAWQQHFAAIYGWDALARVRGFSPPEMHLPNHPDAAFDVRQGPQGVRLSAGCWCRNTPSRGSTGDGLGTSTCRTAWCARTRPARKSRSSASSRRRAPTPSSWPRCSRFTRPRRLDRVEVGGVWIPPIVTQIGDGENGGVMMNEFPAVLPPGGRPVRHRGRGERQCHRVPGDDRAGRRARKHAAGMPADQPGRGLGRINKWEPGAADKAIAEIKKEQPGFSLEGGSWTNNISWVRGYDNVLTPMNQLSADFHQTLDGKQVDPNSGAYRNALFHLLVSRNQLFSLLGTRDLDRICQGDLPRAVRKSCVTISDGLTVATGC